MYNKQRQQVHVIIAKPQQDLIDGLEHHLNQDGCLVVEKAVTENGLLHLLKNVVPDCVILNCEFVLSSTLKVIDHLLETGINFVVLCKDPKKIMKVTGLNDRHLLPKPVGYDELLLRILSGKP